ncbi:hypothetical protein N7537_007824 [Penicillium hordei]|uniref:Uncharacterized protein n=1 Tax=Penicillium hordei TaxID=40994 RepID=A0AAD6GXV1_9EURO|nr:uncharacterized protein N7537_007824 [Penicillium hordei]KAJ5597740.1 hypothetical protein N7537_007824 [Penicillium hordei]
MVPRLSLSQQTHQNDEIDVQDGFGPSYAIATFRVRSDLGNQEPYMRVYLRVPHQGTEFFPSNERAKQAAAGCHREVEAMNAFHEQGSTITPGLFTIIEDIQDKHGIIPGAALSILYSNVSLYKPERDHIRMVFDKEYRKLNKRGWVPTFPWAMNLISDSDVSRFIGDEDVVDYGDEEKMVLEG